MMKVKPIIFFLFVLALFPMNLVVAVEQKFPSWMDEAKFQTGHKGGLTSGGFNEPIDPETGKPTSAASRKHKFFSKPKLPDFNKFREKAMKAKLEKRATGTVKLDSNVQLSIKNLTGLKASETQLDKQIQRAASDMFKSTLMKQKQNLTNKIKALEEIKKLLSNEKVDAPDEVKSSEVRNRIEQLSSYLFNLEKMPAKKLVSPKAQKEERKSFSPSKIPSRFYRPKPFRSFYKESKEEQNND